MKKTVFVFVLVFTLFCTSVYSEDITFNSFEKVLNDAVPATYKLNQHKSKDSGVSYRLWYDGDSSKFEALSFTFIHKKRRFNRMDLMQKPEIYNWNGRRVIFLRQQGLASYMSILLKKGKGLFSVAYMDMAAKWSREDMEKFVANINLEEMEK